MPLPRRKAGPSRKREAFRKVALKYLDPTRPGAGSRASVDPLVVSLSEAKDESFHWLHYARGGDGYVLGFRAANLEVAPFTLHPVEYDLGRQRHTIAGYAKNIEEKLLEVTHSRNAENSVHIGDMAVEYFATMM